MPESPIIHTLALVTAVSLLCTCAAEYHGPQDDCSMDLVFVTVEPRAGEDVLVTGSMTTELQGERSYQWQVTDSSGRSIDASPQSGGETSISFFAATPQR